MRRDSFSELYSAKTNEELLALAAEQELLEPIAKIQLRDELARRNLHAPSGKHSPSESDLNAIDPKQNPAFNTPAKIASVIYLFCLAGLVVAGLSGLWREDKRLIVYVAGSTIIVFGPVFGAIIWATRRHLQKRNSEPRNPSPIHRSWR